MNDRLDVARASVRRTWLVSIRVAVAAAILLSLGVPGIGSFPAAAESAVAEPVGSAGPAGMPGSGPIVLAQHGGTEPRELEPAYAPPAPGKPGPYNEAAGPGYNSDYLFGITRATARSTIVPAVKVPLFLLTVPVDIVLLPFAAIGGFFG